MSRMDREPEHSFLSYCTKIVFNIDETQKKLFLGPVLLTLMFSFLKRKYFLRG
ncbi:hypothetical protein PEDI_47810 [Persicobacter diffluens]|uniref:Uncharacterized protein n=1 Tax=Persicobacter diffluens TaxID=981 RepID=A0AAN4W1T2_9BACT|nr:hypothetical protein PEDI_47810 [Persicobacter diffluens]